MDDDDYAESSVSSVRDEDDFSIEEDDDDAPTRRTSKAKRTFKAKASAATHGRATRSALASEAAPATVDATDAFGVRRSRWDSYDPDECWMCGSERVGVQTKGQIVYCDSCARGFHQRCYGNPLMHGVPPGLWYCKECNSEKRDAAEKRDAEARLMKAAFESMPASLRGDKDVQPQYPAEDDMPFSDAFDEAGPSDAYRAWAIRRLRCDASFMVLWDWLGKFGEAAGITGVTFAMLEAAFIAPATSALLSDMHVAVLHCMGKASVDARTWPRALWRLVDEYDVEFRDVMRLHAKLQRAVDLPAICRQVADAVNAATTGAPSSDAVRMAPPRNVKKQEEEDETSVPEEDHNYLSLPILVRTRLMQVLCEELLTCSHRANQKIITLLEAAGGAQSEAVELDAMHDNVTRVFVTPLFMPMQLMSDVLPAPDTQLITTVRQLTGDPAAGNVVRDYGATPTVGASPALTSAVVSDTSSGAMTATPGSPLRALSRSAALAPGGEDHVIAVAESLAKQRQEGTTSSLSDNNVPVDDRCVEYMFFQDSDGDLRLVRSRRNLPLDSVPRNPSVRSLVVSRLAQRVVKEKDREAARAGIKRAREEVRSVVVLDGADAVKKERKDPALKDAGPTKGATKAASVASVSAAKKKGALSSNPAADGKKQMSLSAFLVTPKPAAATAPPSASPVKAAADAPASATAGTSTVRMPEGSSDEPFVIDIIDGSPPRHVATVAGAQPPAASNTGSIFSVMMKQPKKAVTSETLLEPLVCDGVVFARVPRAPLSMRGDFETVATCLEELRAFVATLADSPLQTDQALANALEVSAVQPADAEIKRIEKERRQVEKQLAAAARQAASGYATRGRRVVVHDDDDDDDDDDEGMYVPRASSSRARVVEEVE